MKANRKEAIGHIKRYGALLVFPIKGRELPLSLWKCFYPRSPMVWDWSEQGDGRVAQLWHLRAELSACRSVVYAKWFQGRATCFSPAVFTAILSLSSQQAKLTESLSRESRILLEILEDNSPIATKQLKELADLAGKSNEARFAGGLRMLWKRLLVVGYGEVEEGGFPSLAIGATQVLFEDLWDASLEIKPEDREQLLIEVLSDASPMYRYYQKLCREIVGTGTGDQASKVPSTE